MAQDIRHLWRRRKLFQLCYGSQGLQKVHLSMGDVIPPWRKKRLSLECHRPRKKQNGRDEHRARKRFGRIAHYAASGLPRTANYHEGEYSSTSHASSVAEAQYFQVAWLWRLPPTVQSIWEPYFSHPYPLR